MNEKKHTITIKGKGTPEVLEHLRQWCEANGYHMERDGNWTRIVKAEDSE